MGTFNIEFIFSLVTSLLFAASTFGALRFQIAQNTKDINTLQEQINRALAQIDNVLTKNEINMGDIRQLKVEVQEEKEVNKLTQINIQDLKIMVAEIKTILNEGRNNKA